MRLFNSLSDSEQHSVLHYCVDTVLTDIVSDGENLNLIADEEIELKADFDEMLVHIKTLTTFEEKAEYIMNNDDFAAMVFDIAADMAHGSFYPNWSENCIFPDAYEEEDDLDEDDLEEGETINLDEEGNVLPQKKKVSQLN
jgi:hypothetical protein